MNKKIHIYVCNFHSLCEVRKIELNSFKKSYVILEIDLKAMPIMSTVVIVCTSFNRLARTVVAGDLLPAMLGYQVQEIQTVIARDRGTNKSTENSNLF